MAKSASLSERDKKVLVDVGERICKTLKGEFFEVSGIPSTAVKYDNNTFKTKPIGGLMFLLDYSYVSSLDTLIFGFSPEGSQLWNYAEIPSHKLEVVFPDLLERTKELMLLNGAPEQAEYVESWSDLIAVLFKDGQLIHAARGEKEKSLLVEAYADNPLFGRFA